MIRRKICFAIFAFCVCLLFGSCKLTPIEARTIEEIKGTYQLTEYYSVEGDKNVDILSFFEYCYMVLGSEPQSGTLIYKQNESDCKKDVTSYISKYQSGSLKYIEEIKIKFIVPGDGEEYVLNYFTVSPDDKLVCQKFIYGKAENNGAANTEKVVRITFRKISSIDTLEVVQQYTGEIFS